jgi:hypothetical protein
MSPRSAAENGPWPAWAYLVAALLPIGVWALSLRCYAGHRDLFLVLTSEDGWVENAQALLFVGGAVLCALIARHLRRPPGSWWAVCYGVATVGLAFVAAEEISWGQRLLGFDTPAWFARNRQGETNFHNLPGFRNVLIAIVLPTLVLSVAGGLYVWFLRREAWARLRAYLWLPHPILLPTWVCVFNMPTPMARLRFAGSPDTREGLAFQRLQEPAELLLAFGVVVFLIHALSWVKREIAEPAPR